VPDAELKVNHGIVGDAPAADWHRQVSLLAVESIEKMVAAGAKVSPGDFAENITTEGIKLTALSVGDTLCVGQAVKIEITQLGKKCHSRCAIYEQIGDCIMPREGIFARVVEAGRIEVGDIVELMND
jgi:MOSC domain-containing protein YiiM